MKPQGSNIKTRVGNLFLILFTIMLTVALPSDQGAGAREITDMVGRRVTVNRTGRIWSAYPPITYLMYALDPSLLIGWTGPLSPESRKYIRDPYRGLPVVGGWFGQRTPNLESLASAKPDLALVWDQSLSMTPNMVEKLGALSIPVVAVRLTSLADYPKALYFLGELLEKKQRAHELAARIEQTLVEMKSFSGRIPEAKKVSVYYATGADGLTNYCDHLVFLDEAIELAGGRNPHRCSRADWSLGSKIDLERLLAEDPEVIITQDDAFFSRVYSDTRYKRLRAVKTRRIYVIPAVPFNWLNRPPSFMRALGIKWLASVLYPQQYTVNLRKEVKAFFKLFLGVDISDNEAREILRQPVWR